MVIAVDFDGTIVEHKYPKIGKELPMAIDVLTQLQKDGHKLILWSVREGKLLDEAVLWCRERGLEFFAVNSEYPGGGWKDNSSTSRKIKADVYIDDRNLGGVPDWGEVYEILARQHFHRHSHHKKSFFKKLAEKCAAARLKSF